MKKRILIVGDDKASLERLKSILQSESYIVDTAETGREAIEKSKARYYNLALLDIKLPDMDGTELLSAMPRRIPPTRKIMITGHPSLENAIKAVSFRPDGYVLKPVEPSKLLHVVEENLKEQEEVEEYRSVVPPRTVGI